MQRPGARYNIQVKEKLDQTVRFLNKLSHIGDVLPYTDNFQQVVNVASHGA